MSAHAGPIAASINKKQSQLFPTAFGERVNVMVCASSPSLQTKAFDSIIDDAQRGKNVENRKACFKTSRRTKCESRTSPDHHFGASRVSSVRGGIRMKSSSALKSCAVMILMVSGL